MTLNLSSKVFSYFGPPKILQLDNGREFVNGIVKKLVEDWPGEIRSSMGVHGTHRARVSLNEEIQRWKRCWPVVSICKRRHNIIHGPHGFQKSNVSSINSINPMSVLLIKVNCKITKKIPPTNSTPVCREP